MCGHVSDRDVDYEMDGGICVQLLSLLLLQLLCRFSVYDCRAGISTVTGTAA